MKNGADDEGNSNVDYAINIIRPIITGKATKVELKQAAEDKWVHDVQKALKGMVWNTGCKSVCFPPQAHRT